MALGRLPRVLVRLVLATLTGTPGAASSDDFGHLLASRAGIALDLARPIEACVRRHDTRHPAFHGCIDWHSSVHGNWALTAYGAALRDQRFEALLRESLAPERLARERADLARNPAFEMPYGRAWFLRLVREFERSHPGDERLRAFGDEVADSLAGRYAGRVPDPDARDYESDAWALVNLHEYAVHRGNAPLRSRVEALVARVFIPATVRCQARAPERGFMAVCTTHAWLVSRVMPKDAFVRWVRDFMPPASVPPPVADAASAHLNGLNFSRAWGLWHVFAATGDDAYRDLYAAHVLSSYRRRASWDGDYDTVSHWVAQFAMLAIQPLFMPDAGPATR